MSSDLPYRDQVSLLLQLLPIVGREMDFALKGGTAINLFVRDLPRLSVDIDLTSLPLSDRAIALVAIHDGMARMARSITQLIPRIRVQMSANPRENSHRAPVLSLHDTASDANTEAPQPHKFCHLPLHPCKTRGVRPL